MSFETILLDVDATDHVATITLNRPEQLNSFNRTMCEEMARAWRQVKLDDSVHAVVLRAAGDAGIQRRIGHQGAVRATRQRLEPRRSRRGTQPEVAEDVEARGVRRSGHVHGRRVLLRQRVRRRHLFDGRNVLRLTRLGRPGLRAGADRADAPRRSGRDAADSVDGQRRTRQRRDRAADRLGIGSCVPRTAVGACPRDRRARSPRSRRRRPRAR